MILDATGAPVRAVLEMTRDQVRWFLNGKSFLRHLHVLHQVKVAPFCQVCYAKGLPDTVSGRRVDGRFVVFCGHREAILDWNAIKDTDGLLARLGWSLRCEDCERKGMLDGVQGNSDSQWGTCEVNCGCTERRYQVPLTRH